MAREVMYWTQAVYEVVLRGSREGNMAHGPSRLVHIVL
jgi:hypothetical protein